MAAFLTQALSLDLTVIDFLLMMMVQPLKVISIVLPFPVLRQGAARDCFVRMAL
jgi:hypothetical protein